MLALQELDHTLTSLHTATDIRQCIIMLLQTKLLAVPLRRHCIARDEVRQLIGKQLQIHPMALLQGRLCIGWQQAQQNAFRNYSPWRSGKAWAYSTVKALWQLSYAIWNHRNTILHQKQENHPDVNPDDIDLSILEEWTIGPDPTWDQASRSLFLGTTCENLLNKPINHRIQWLYYVRLARKPITNTQE